MHRLWEVAQPVINSESWMGRTTQCSALCASMYACMPLCMPLGMGAHIAQYLRVHIYIYAYHIHVVCTQYILPYTVCIACFILYTHSITFA